MHLKSPAFEHNGELPRKYTCDGPDISPPLEWSSVPENAESLVLIMDDPDAPGGTFVHWIAYNIPANRNDLPEAIPAMDELQGFQQGRNDFGKIGYGGACPPHEHNAHRYNFRLYALDRRLEPKSRLTKNEIGRAMEGHTLGEARITARYERPKREDRIVDEAGKESFPASDPPSWAPGGAGNPNDRQARR